MGASPRRWSGNSRSFRSWLCRSWSCRSWLCRSWLYRNGRWAPILARPIFAMLTFAALIFPILIFPMMSVSSSSLLAAQTLAPFGRKPPTDNGPRALGLVQVSPKGKKARFIPIAIMMDGKFYDASAYKADPVPMALEFGIVYEAFRTGVSQGTFTITQPGQLNRTWIAEGSWLPAGSVDPHARKKYTTPVIADDPYGPPVLHRRTPKSEPDSASDSGSAAKDASQN